MAKDAENKKKKPYEKPIVEKHKALALVSGSGCDTYTSRTTWLDDYYY